MAAFAVLMLAYWVVAPLVATLIDARLNTVVAHQPYPTSDHARQLHQRLQVADLHGDALLWRRDLLKRNRRGHMDLPRMRDGGFALQVFPSVTQSPSGLNYENNSAGSIDQITLLAIAQHWPVKTWGSLYQRALYHADRLQQFAARSDDQLRLVRNQRELTLALTDNAIAGILATEGAHSLEGELGRLEGLFEAGYRIVGLQHFFDNALGGSLHGVDKSGLSDFGRTVLRELNDRQMIIDLAHSSEAVVREALALNPQPMMVSHTGIKSLCDTPRNIADSLLQEIAANGGLIGIGFWDAAICEVTPAGIAVAIVHAIDLLGVDHVALGSDFDGTVTPPFDASEMIALTQALIDVGLSDAHIRAVMGGNAIRFFQQNLPR